jgi:hypothetical protein|nr:MAG TPA: hypothetical protein [Caudoviricetes sp.]
MDLQKIIELLKAQMPNATDDEVKAAAEKMLDEAKREADRRATEATKTAVENYEKKHNLKDGKPSSPETPSSPAVEPSKAEEAPAWAKALIESNQALQAKVDALEKGKVTDGRKAVFDQMVAKLPDSLRAAYSRTSYQDLSDDAFDKLRGEIEKEIDDIVKDQKTKGATFSPRASDSGKTSDSDEASKEDVEAVIKASPSFGKL